ncbi:BsuPI-related putative proteinase inhibitor [Gracilibacillus xinjiangensis]|uniref:Intracellular proteinase inhibitor BsuPI domain-containing protein n=1 Tax=Gracilibacillus xinjiangensis TaxID=1193282 RepID=A0ABV8WXX5_9BACI
MKKLSMLLVLLMFSFTVACGETNSETETEGDQSNTQEKEESESAETESVMDHVEVVTEAVQQDDGIHFRFELINQHSEDVLVTFPSGKQYDIIVKKGDELVYQYSDDKVFTEALVEETIESGESKVWEEVWQPGQEVEPGEYSVEMQLLPSKLGQEDVEEGLFTNNFTVQIADRAEETSADGDELIRNVEVTGENGSYQVTGEVHPSIGNLYYEVEDGHNYLVEKTEIPVEGEDWYTFSIDVSIAEKDLPFNGVIMMMIFNEDRSYTVPVQLEQIQ